MTAVSFDVRVTLEDARRFAELSGDHNPLHVDPAYAAGTTFGRPILHGAYAAGLLSRMAGMHLPGRSCLLHGLRLSFIAPIHPPAELRVTGTPLQTGPEVGEVRVVIDDKSTGMRLVEGSYRYGHHQQTIPPLPDVTPLPSFVPTDDRPVILVTGGSGGLGSALLELLGTSGQPLPRDPDTLFAFPQRPIAGIVHCGWPTPDNQRVTQLATSTRTAIAHHVAAPLEQMITLAQALVRQGVPGAPLILVGSTMAQPGWHHYRMPLYSLGKSLIPTLTGILALELGAQGRKCLGVAFDIIAGPGMNAGMHKSLAIRHGDRSPHGRLITTREAAQQLQWLLGNPSIFTSGAMLTLSGGMTP
ncbi:MAG: SDR family oxidoreductase [Magnetococcales bacterium]|nr:SDR family oxidoreductase [Magnetococcales bacterium]